MGPCETRGRPNPINGILVRALEGQTSLEPLNPLIGRREQETSSGEQVWGGGDLAPKIRE